MINIIVICILPFQWKLAGSWMSSLTVSQNSESAICLHKKRRRLRESAPSSLSHEVFLLLFLFCFALKFLYLEVFSLSWSSISVMYHILHDFIEWNHNTNRRTCASNTRTYTRKQSLHTSVPVQIKKCISQLGKISPNLINCIPFRFSALSPLCIWSTFELSLANDSKHNSWSTEDGWLNLWIWILHICYRDGY